MLQDILKESSFDNVFDSQQIFKILMDAMSRPGKIYKLYSHNFSKVPECLNPFVISILKTLGDNNVTFSAGDDDSEVLHKYIEVNTGMAHADFRSADYALFDGKEFDKNLLMLNNGTLEFPESSATAIISVESILQGKCKVSAADNTELHMSGPGIQEKHILTITGLDREYINTLKEANAVFPLGVDTIFIDDGGNMTCMPRTTKVEVK